MATFQGVGRSAVSAIAAIAVAGCVAAVPPRPVMSPWSENARFGYTDHMLDATRVEVTYRTPYTPVATDPTARSLRVEEVRELATDLALLRAAEIAHSRGSPAFAIVDTKFDTETEIHTSAGSIPRYGYRHTLPGVRAIERPGPDIYTTWLQGEATLRAVLKQRAGPGDIDAAATISRLSAKYDGVMATDVD
jgi:hypothetical protein